MDNGFRTSAALADELRVLGLRRGALVMVHASLRKIGPVVGGADGLIDAIESAIGETGTMLMVLGAADTHAWVNERPEAERAVLLADAEPFDALITPAVADVGVLAEVFRRRPETLVSDHPEGRFAAAGQAAASLLEDVPWDDYFGPGSPLARLVADGGQVLRLGADLNTVTVLHHAEYRCTVEPKRRVRRHRLVSTCAGGRIRVVECLDDEKGIVDYDGEDYFEDLLRDYLETGAGTSGKVGEAQAELLDAADLVGYGVGWMNEHLRGVNGSWAIDELRRRLDRDLQAARKGRRPPEVNAIRGLKSALANAEAVPVADGPYKVIEGSADVPRRLLEAADIERVLGEEIDERQRAIAEYRGHELDTADLELELATLRRYREDA